MRLGRVYERNGQGLLLPDPRSTPCSNQGHAQGQATGGGGVTQYLKKSFSVSLGTDAYQKNYEAVFGKKRACARCNDTGYEVVTDTSRAPWLTTTIDQPCVCRAAKRRRDGGSASGG